MASSGPRWRQAYDAVDRAVTPRAEAFVRTPGFAQGAALVQRAQKLARDSARGLTARAWHLLNLPAGSDVSRLRAQIGALDREVRRLNLQLETERRRGSRTTTDPTIVEDLRADGAEPADDPRPRPARRRAQRPAGP
ncbi:hypothetical protein ACI797_12375 [Geodermatophilus sp. SYSU D00691]